MAQFLPFSSATVNLDQVTHITRNNQSLVFHLTSGHMIQIEVPPYWSADQVTTFMRAPHLTEVHWDGRLFPVHIK